MDRVKIFNGKIVTPVKIIENGCVIIEKGKIVKVGEGNEKTDNCLEINAHGDYVSPGFIDIHTHGGGGHDFMDGTVDAFLGACRMHAKHGTTSLVPTTLASENNELKNIFEVLKTAKKQNSEGANILGIHLEGPYFSMEQKGAQDPKYIKKPNPKEYNEILKWSDDIIRWSAAPELEGIKEFGVFLKENGILGSIAHSDAIYEQVREAFENGFTHVTHLYSGMSGVKRINLYRYAGVIESAFLIDDMTVEVIADGSHLPASLLKLVYKIKGPAKTALITDSMRAAGMPDGDSILGSLKNGQKVIVEDGVAKLPDRLSFAGSVATADRLVRTFHKLVEIPLIDVIAMMTETPAAIIGVSKKKGSLVLGKDADIVIFNEDVNIKMTIINGRIVYEKPVIL
ncbi:MAG: N-acetylglucosamine-6-phosphate deacetylase [Clostridia bacterium]|jgi:N-acetylglucosamine-6-phosphate deacetylase